MRLSARHLVPALALIACGPLPENGEDLASDGQEIINGRACQAGEEPATVAILIDTTLEIPGYGTQVLKTVICTGTLIAPDVVVAAAHCVDPNVIGEGIATPKNMKFWVTFTSDLTALAEQRTRTFPGDSVLVKKAVKHPQFALPSAVNGPGNWHDVSLLFLSKALTVTPEVVVTMNESAQIGSGKAVQIVGWGQQTQTGQFEQPPAGTVGRKMCASTSLGVVGQFEMQVGTDAASGRKCHGDSGGPTFLTLDTPTASKRRLVGITSHAFDDTDCTKGGVDTRVDAVRGWMDQEMTKACSDGTRVWCQYRGVIPPDWTPPAEDPGSAGDAPKPKGCGCDAADFAPGVSFLALFARRRTRREA